MASNARMFFAGVGTTFVILAVGFSGGLLLAKSALHDRPEQMRASSEPAPGMRVVLPPSSEPAIQVVERTIEPKPSVQPAQEVQAPVQQRVEKAKMTERDLKAERRRSAERKARRIAAARAQLQDKPREQTVPGIMAFGGNDPRMRFFGN